MPYINTQKRNELDTTIQNLVDNIDLESWQGDLNYCITKIALKIINKTKLNYSNLNNMIGVFECVKQEFYRRMLSTYEDRKIKENGDVY